MLAKTKQDSAVGELDELLGPPPLIRGEDTARFWRLHAAITHEVKPVSTLDKIWVRDIVDKLWHQQRCKQGAASLIEGAYVEALASFLSSFNSPMTAFAGDVALEMARNYYTEENKSQRKAVELHLAVYRITEEQIRAKAMELCGGGVLMFNKMETYCEKTLLKLQKEIDRRTADENNRARGSDQPPDEAVK